MTKGIADCGLRIADLVRTLLYDSELKSEIRNPKSEIRNQK
jgi:hypothetical protein